MLNKGPNFSSASPNITKKMDIKWIWTPPSEYSLYCFYTKVCFCFYINIWTYGSCKSSLIPYNLYYMRIAYCSGVSWVLSYYFRFVRDLYKNLVFLANCFLKKVIPNEQKRCNIYIKNSLIYKLKILFTHTVYIYIYWCIQW